MGGRRPSADRTGAVFLSEEESRHGVRVLRLQAGAVVTVVDGKGGWYQCEVTRPDARRCELRVLNEQQDYGRRPYRIHVAIAPTKNADRMEWFVEKSVELGVDEISFPIGDHSERRVFKTDRLEKIAIGAMKQSRRALLPLMHGPESFSSFIGHPRTDQLFIAYVDENAPRDQRSRLSSVAEPKGSYCVLIGPEGDFSAPEIKAAVEAGFRPVSLGESRLRTETAGLVACHLLHVIHYTP
ncbi:MAG: 16S rRNA (uracil(1498)-N(3))-methyltransferase [Ferruginibacter sp.]|nr:16S rRNA (uracil(1498)-N(3))-methyltransferase [Cytophagales bacterium]